jgi:3'-phosphoadenosine 5'-phosphosulfate sulfotransferase (PAPS reductase)/FAD synthetase
LKKQKSVLLRKPSPLPSGKDIYILSFSGGKDSTAMLLYLLKEKGLRPYVVFCNTSNETQDTYQYIDYVSALIESWGFSPIIKLKGEFSFYSLAKYKKRFPSIKARFCTEVLKILPQMLWIEDQGLEIPIIVTGIRREESFARLKRQEWELSSRVYGQRLWNPIIERSAKEIFDIHKKYGVEINTMYQRGFKRVGCFPCVNIGRYELILLDNFYPERVAEIAQQEKKLGSTYFHPRRPGKIWGIDDHILWAKRSSPNLIQLKLFPDEEEKFCAYAGLGVCK